MITNAVPVMPNTDDDVAERTPGLADSDIVHEKLDDAQTPGYQAEFDPLEAEAAGAFREDALSEDDALASSHDYADFVKLPSPRKP